MLLLRAYAGIILMRDNEAFLVKHGEQATWAAGPLEFSWWQRSPGRNAYASCYL